MKNRLMAAYVAVAIAIMALPLVGLLWKKSAASTENRRLAAFPSIRTETQEGWNTEYLPQLGAYFADHFAYRQEFVTADALLRGKLFGVSTQDGVIQGTDGWLYYQDSLADYLGSAPLSARGIFNVAHTLKLMQDYVQGNGRNFLFVMAPNKNTLYDANMPYYDKVKASGTHNRDLLAQALREEQVAHVNLVSAFRAQGEVLYHARDSHWNNKGAALAAESMLDALGRAHTSYQDAPFAVRKDFTGDLDQMLYPLATTLEEEIYYDGAFTYAYEGEVESNFDPEIRTTQPEADGSLLMFRDSFGNALLPFLAQEFGAAKFTRGVPYHMDEIFFTNADTVIVERAERFLPDMATSPPVMQAPKVDLDVRAAEGSAAPAAFAATMETSQDGQFRKTTMETSQDGQFRKTTMETSQDGLFLKISGRIDPQYVQTHTRIYLRLDKEDTYEAFPMNVEIEGETFDNGYALYLEKGTLAEEMAAELYVETDGNLQKVAQETIQPNSGTITG